MLPSSLAIEGANAKADSEQKRENMQTKKKKPYTTITSHVGCKELQQLWNKFRINFVKISAKIKAETVQFPYKAKCD